MLATEENRKVPHDLVRLRCSLAQPYMRLKVVTGSAEQAVFEVRTAEELAVALAEGGWTRRLSQAGDTQVHLWHRDAWWNLSDDLSEFFAWIIEMRGASFDETQQFAAAPFSRSDWLFEAARQMHTLLDVAYPASSGTVVCAE